jgi:hypothetical protein
LLSFRSLIPKTGRAKNKVEKVGMFVAIQKAPSKTPQLPRIPPQNHHVFTTRKHLKNAKPPAKPPFSPPNIFPQKPDPPSSFPPSKPIGRAGTPHAASEVVLPYPAPET